MKIELTTAERNYLLCLLIEELSTNLRELPEESEDLKNFFSEVRTVAGIYLKIIENEKEALN